MRKINITRTVKNILLLLSIFLFFLVLLFGLLFSNFKEKAYINSMQMANANDIDGDGKADQIERDDNKIEFQKSVHNDQMQIEKEKLEIQKEKVNADIYKADKMAENKKIEKK